MAIAYGRAKRGLPFHRERAKFQFAALFLRQRKTKTAGPRVGGFQEKLLAGVGNLGGNFSGEVVDLLFDA